MYLLATRNLLFTVEGQPFTMKHPRKVRSDSAAKCDSGTTLHLRAPEP